MAASGPVLRELDGLPMRLGRWVEEGIGLAHGGGWEGELLALHFFEASGLALALFAPEDRQIVHLAELAERYESTDVGVAKRGVKMGLLRELGDPDAEYGVGDVVQFPTPDGQGAYAGVVRDVGSDWLLFDFNHPLAGQPVRFEVQVLGIL